MKIAIARAACGYTTCVGPNDYQPDEHPDAIDAARSYMLEAGYIPVATYWAEVALPPLPAITVLPASIEES